MSTQTENQFNFTPKAHISISRVDHNTSIMRSVDDIFQKQLFTDVCLSCENQIINAHRLILAASTSFFHSLFSQQPCCLNPNPVIVIRDMKINELKAILEFIYYGTVTVPESELDSLIKSAESLGVYGLSKLNTDKLNELNDDDENERPETEINNNNSINHKPTQASSSKSSNAVQSSKMSSHSNVLNHNNTDHNTSKNGSMSTKMFKRSKIINRLEDENQKNESGSSGGGGIESTTSRKSIREDSDRITNKDLDEKRKKRELINLQISMPSMNNEQSLNDSLTSNDESTQSSKRKSLRIRCKKTTPDLNDKDSSAYDLLNASNNSNISLSEALRQASSSSSNANKRFKSSNSDTNLVEEDDLMSVDGSEYNVKKDSQDHTSQETTGSTNLLKKLSAIKALKLRRNKHSILKNQSDQSKQFKLMLKKSDIETYTLSSKKSNSQSNEVLTDDNDDDEDEDDDVDGDGDVDQEDEESVYEENIVLKKLDAPLASNNHSTSRKNSLDSNNTSSIVRMNRSATAALANEKHHEEETARGSQSLLASSSLIKQTTQQIQLQKNQKKKRMSIDK